MMPEFSRRAMAITYRDLPLSDRPIAESCQCDCACPTTHRPAIDRHPSAKGSLSACVLVRSPHVFEIALDEEHSALMDTCGPGGVVVANGPARQVLRVFDSPVSVADVCRLGIDQCEETVGNLLLFGILQEVGGGKQPQWREDDSLSVWLHLTDACNLRCTYCYVNKGTAVMSAATGRAALDSIFSSAKRHGFKTVRLKYAGGEPSLESDLVLLLHAHAQRQARTTGLGLTEVILTNGVGLSTSFIQELRAGGIRVMLSLDGVGSPHDVQRPFPNGAGSFHLVEQTLERLIGAGVLPQLSITITSNNLSGLHETVRYALERRLPFSLNFHRGCDVGRPALGCDDQSMLDGVLRAYAAIAEDVPPWSLLGSILDRGQLVGPRQRPCGVGQNCVILNQWAGVCQCQMDMKHPLGDVFTSDPVELVRQGRRIQNPPVDDKEDCCTCQWQYWCCGGCPIVAQRSSGSFASRSPHCDVYKAIYPEAIRLEGLRLLRYATVQPYS